MTVVLQSFERVVTRTTTILFVAAVLFAFVRALDFRSLDAGAPAIILPVVAVWAVGRLAWGKRAAAQAERRKPRRRALPPPPNHVP